MSKFANAEDTRAHSARTSATDPLADLRPPLSSSRVDRGQGHIFAYRYNVIHFMKSGSSEIYGSGELGKLHPSDSSSSGGNSDALKVADAMLVLLRLR